MKKKVQFLVVEDDVAIAELLQVNLKHAGFDSFLAEDGECAQQRIDEVLPDLVILDWMLPKCSGVSLAKRWRADHRTKDLPIIMLTARHEELDRVAGLDAGADDYLVKPFSIKELLARVRALLRRKAPEILAVTVESCGLVLQPESLMVSYQGNSCKLGGNTESNLLNFLMHYKNQVHSRSKLLDKVWGDHVFIEDRTVDVQVKRLRKSLSSINAQHLIETIRGVGYCFNTQTTNKDGI